MESSTKPEWVWDGTRVTGNTKPTWDILIKGLKAEEMHTLAGVCLDGNAGGFSRAEVDRLHAIAEDIRPRMQNVDAIEFLHDTARKINRLLNPIERAPDPPPDEAQSP